jgi:hypothetical protein
MFSNAIEPRNPSTMRFTIDKPSPLPSPGARATNERFEDPSHIARCDAGTAVFDLKHRRLVQPMDADIGASAWWGRTESIVDQIADHRSEEQTA